MDITMLKSSLWGYSKSSVCEYIAAMNEDFSHKLMATVKENDGRIKELEAKISQLETENNALREERDFVASVMEDAKKFSNELKEKAEQENKRFRESNTAYNNEQFRRIMQFSDGIDRVRNSMHSLIKSFDSELEKSKDELTELSNGLKQLDSFDEVKTEDEK